METDVATQKNNRDFKGVWIPAIIWESDSLSLREKCLLVEIDSLDKGQGCYASNAYLGKFLGISEGQTANIITDLRKRGLVVTVKFDGRTRYLKVVQENLNRGFRKTLTDDSGKPEGSPQENLNVYIRNSNTSINEVEALPDGIENSEKQRSKKSQSEQTNHKILSEDDRIRELNNVPPILKNNIDFCQTSLPPNLTLDMAPPKKIKKSSVDDSPTKKEGVSVIVNQDHLDVFEAYKAKVYPVARKNMTNIIHGIPLALNMFREDHKEKAKEKLIQALTALGKQYDSDPYWIKKVNDERGIFWRAPKHVFSKGHIEHTLLNLSYEIKSNEQPNRHLSKRSTTEAERRAVKEANQRSFDKIMAQSKERQAAADNRV